MEEKHKTCTPCEGDMPPMTREEAEKRVSNVSGWGLSDDARSIHKEVSFANFKATMFFVNAVAAIAESEGHHPDLEVHYGKVAISLSTHKINGLSENDIILAAKIDEFAERFGKKKDA